MEDKLDIKCIYCGELNKNIHWTPNSVFECEKCKQRNFVTADLKAKKLVDVTYNDVLENIKNSSNSMDDEEIKKIAKQYYKENIEPECKKIAKKLVITEFSIDESTEPIIEEIENGIIMNIEKAKGIRVVFGVKHED